MITVLRGCVGAITSAAVIKALQAHGVRVVGMDSDPHSVGFRLCDAYYLVPQPTDSGYIGFILQICEEEGVDAILPSAEEEIIPLTSNRMTFYEKRVKLLCPPFTSCCKCADKRLTYTYFEEAGIPMPVLYEQHTARFPCIVKPRTGRGGKGVFLVEDQAELEWRLARNPGLIIQDYIDGTPWAVDVLTDWDGTILSMVSRQKYLVQSGSMTKGITKRDDEAISWVRKIVSDLELTGPTMVEYMRGEDGPPKFIEINTRFGGGGGALSIAANPTIIPNLIRMIKGEKGPQHLEFTEGLEMLRYYSELFSVAL